MSVDRVNRMIYESVDSATPKLVTAAVTLAPHERHVIVTLPASADFDITLPPVASCPGAEFFIEATGTGSAEVGLQDQNDSLNALDESDKLSAAKDYYCVKNWAGRQWLIVEEVTT